MADCNEALRLAPDEPTTFDSRGFTYLKLGRFEQAIADYDAALARNPRDPGSLYGAAVSPDFGVKMILKAAALISRRRKRSTRVSSWNLLATDLASDALNISKLAGWCWPDMTVTMQKGYPILPPFDDNLLP